MTAPRALDPLRLDVAAFALAEGRLGGDWPLTRMPRLLADALPLSPDSPAQSVRWSVRGSHRAVAGSDTEIRLHLRACTALQLSCQRCLQALTVQIDVQPSLRFVHGEAEAEALDEDSEDDVLALTPHVDLQRLTEDELILALPLVPRHETCPEPLPMSVGEEALQQTDDNEHAFAALAALRRGGSGKPN